MRLPWRPVLLAVLLASAGLTAGPSDVEAAYTYVWPTKGRITQSYGCTGFSWEPRRGNCAHFHSGIDIANSAGTPIRAATSGVVQLVGYNPYDQPGDRAWVVVIRHDAGFTGWYAHMQAKYVSGVRAGSRVRTGQLIGYMGNTGRSTGVHLHFAFFRNGEPFNPKLYLPPWRSTSTTTTKPKPKPTVGTADTKPRTITPVVPAIVAAPVWLPVDYAWFFHDADHGYAGWELYRFAGGVYRALAPPLRR